MKVKTTSLPTSRQIKDAVLNDYFADGGLFVFNGDTARGYVDDLGLTRCQRIIASNGKKYVIFFDRLAARQGQQISNKITTVRAIYTTQEPDPSVAANAKSGCSTQARVSPAVP